MFSRRGATREEKGWFSYAAVIIGTLVLCATALAGPWTTPSIANSPPARLVSDINPGADGSFPAKVASKVKRPNILFIVTDDQRGGLEVMPETSRWFGNHGRTFPNAFVTTPTCCPSRTSILTGRYAHNHGVTTNFDPSALDHSTTLHKYLHDSGYRTGFFGKFLNSWGMRNPPPFIDEFAIFALPGDYFGGTWNINGNVRSVSSYSTTFTRRRSVRFLRSSETTDEQPWYLHIAPLAPHAPFTPEPKYRSATVPRWDGNPAVFERNKSDKPPYVRRGDVGFKTGRKIRQKQYRTLMSVDDLVGRIARTLRALRESRDTLAIFVSDNGYMWSEHGLLKKDVPYTQSVNVPLAMRWPGHIRRSVDRRLVANIDIAPTVLRAARYSNELTVPMDGRDLLGKSWHRRRLLQEHWCNVRNMCNVWASIRRKRYQYVEYYGRSGQIRFREYYNLRRDPWQLRNLLHDGTRANDPNTNALHRMLRRDRRCMGTSCP